MSAAVRARGLGVAGFSKGLAGIQSVASAVSPRGFKHFN